LRVPAGEQVGGGQADGQVRVAQVGHEFGEIVLGAVGQFTQGGAALTGADDPPDAAVLVVPQRVVQRHLVVADDAGGEVGDVEGTVGAQLDVHGAEPRVVAADQIGHFDRPVARAVHFQAVAVDAVGDDVADEDVIVELGREVVGGVVGDAG